MNQNYRDLKIYGQGSTSGGKFKNVIIKGSGQIKGDMECNNLKIYGDGQFDGNLKVEDNINIKGKTEFNGEIKAKKFKIQGEVQVKGEIFADDTSITGNITTDNDFNAETFTSEGGFTINGLLNADQIKINIYWPCKVHEIGCSEIKVKKDVKMSFLGLKDMIKPVCSNKILTADIIEGDLIYLENTNAKIVRGNNVTIGTGCKIELVEYKESFKKDEKSIVDKNNKI
ncbi:polymer-forming cytoskeletal protein [Methanobacterium sp.]|uniref:polymer-forming cytoskeletal protein n=3 Tax=Methanobacterium sp. TaxID=2164 RepID=UPI003C776FB4